jgi:hypothetical protein
VERPSLHDRPLIVERRSLRYALRAPVETTEIAYAIALPEDGRWMTYKDIQHFGISFSG